MLKVRSLQSHLRSKLEELWEYNCHILWPQLAKLFVSKHKKVVKAFIKAHWAKNWIFTHFQAKGFENSISKNNFQRFDGLEYVSNMSQMIKIIILYGLYSHSEACGSFYSDLKKNGSYHPIKKFPNIRILKIPRIFRI